MAVRKKKQETPELIPEARKPERWQELEQQYADLPTWEEEPAPTPEPEEYLNPLEQKVRLRQLQFIEAYIASVGNIGAACKLVKVSRMQAWRWFKIEWFQKQINERMFEWELLLRNKMMSLALSGNTTMLIFLSKFLNPFYDDNYRARVLLGEMAQSLYERYPIPQPEFLPPKIPERFRASGADIGTSAEGTGEVSPTLVHSRGDQ